MMNQSGFNPNTKLYILLLDNVIERNKFFQHIEYSDV